MKKNNIEKGVCRVSSSLPLPLPSFPGPRAPGPVIAIVGIGLMGGSLGLAAKKKNLARKVIALSRRESTVQKALETGAVDEGSTEPGAFLSEAEIVFIGAPVDLTIHLVKKIMPFLKKGCVVTDLGSTKEKLVREADKLMKNSQSYFVGGHPMCGSEKSGVEFSSAHLYDGATYILTPTKHTNKKAFSKLKAFVQKLGAKPVTLEPSQHDALLSQTSHFPHLAAFLLVKAASRTKDSENFFRFAASGFRDTTRVAGSPVDVWRDIFLHNKKNILRDINAFKKEFALFENALKRGNVTKLTNMLSEAKVFRDAFEKAYAERKAERRKVKV